MSTNIAHAEDAWLNAETLFEEWAIKFIQEWYRPIAEMQIGMLLKTLPPDVAEQLRAMNPEGYELMIKKYGGE